MHIRNTYKFYRCEILCMKSVVRLWCRSCYFQFVGRRCQKHCNTK